MANASSVNYLEYFLDLPNERIVFARRQHWTVLLPNITFSILLTLLFFIGSIFFFLFIYPSFEFFLIAACIGISITIAFVAKVVSDWHFHLYILTTDKIIEVWYSPLFSHTVNEILLNQVRCTEINQRNSGFLQSMCNVGNLVLTFDELTRKEEFVFKNIHNPKATISELHRFFNSFPTTAPQVLFERKEVSIYEPKISFR